MTTNINGPMVRSSCVALLVMASLAHSNLLAQTAAVKNLVPNGSFEEVSKEPKTFDQLSRAQGWGDVTIGMAELFSKSASVKTVGIPENFYGTMEPHEGARYAGFFAWKDDQRRDYDGDPEDPFMPGWSAYSEYPWIELPSTLKEGQVYEVSFQVALAGNSDRAVAGIGALVSPLELNYQNRSFLRERPQVVETKILEERGVWVEVKGTFKADGDERYLIIGTFPTAIFETKRIIEGPDNQYAYYYLDSVVLREVHEEEAGK
ncbi:MAG: hypothetical protein K8H89_16560 [Flavobacteriales bacterium]|nr:hypothetical protein [Flavobacteriales bacterium]